MWLTVQGMVAAFEERKKLIAEKLRAIPGTKLAEPQGAFYVLPEMSAFFGPGAEGKDFGPVPDSEAFCVYLLQKAHVSVVWGMDGAQEVQERECMDGAQEAQECWGTRLRRRFVSTWCKRHI